ncbi:MAG: hypothetical protein LJE57_09335 [Gallionella sp.]|nr:hypothetical protein [Gallionella sp.]
MTNPSGIQLILNEWRTEVRRVSVAAVRWTLVAACARAISHALVQSNIKEASDMIKKT